VGKEGQMAELKPKIEEVVDEDSFGRWLMALYFSDIKPIARILAVRIRLRVLPFVILTRKYHSEDGWLAFILALRCNVASRVASIRPKYDILEVYRTASINIFDLSSSYAGFQYNHEKSFFAFCSNSYSVERDEGESILATQIAADLTARAVFPEEETIWQSLRQDLRFIEDGLDNEALLKKPLWLDAPEWWNDAWQEMQNNLLSPENIGDRWDIWLDWYWNVSKGFDAFQGLGYKLVDFERRIALGDGREDFWNREAGDINREIAKWIAEAREPEMNAPLDEADFKSRPASIETAVRGGLVVLAHDVPLSDLSANTAQAAATDLAQGLKQLASDPAAAQVDPRIAELLLRAAQAIEQAVHDQTRLFESGRNQKALSRYSETVDAEWSPILAAQYHGLVVQFAQVLNHFEAWREFIAKPIVAAVPIKPAEFVTDVEEIYQGLTKNRAAFADVVLVRLQTLTISFREAVNRLQGDDASNPVATQIIEAMQSDLAVSVSNVVLSYLQREFQHYGALFVDGAALVIDNGVLAAGGLAATAAIHAIGHKLQKHYPDLYGTIVKAIKALRKFKKDTEPE
jgi:hypothetical protein